MSGFEQTIWKRTILGLCGNLMPNFYRPPAGVLFPYAHIVSDNAPLHVRHLYAVPSRAKFESDLDFLCRKYRPLALSDLERVSAFSRSKQSPRYFVLSFDDGMREVYDVVAPILRAKGIPAIFSLISATIDNKELMWRHKISLLIERSRHVSSRMLSQCVSQTGKSVVQTLKALRFTDKDNIDKLARSLEIDFDDYLRSSQPYLTTSQVLDLAKSGFEIGAHSESHPFFDEIEVKDQKRQILNSVQFIRRLGLPCKYFAFPHNDIGVPLSVFRYMTELGLAISFGSSEGRLDPVTFSFQRFALDAENCTMSLQALMKQMSAKSFLRSVLGTELIPRDQLQELLSTQDIDVPGGKPPEPVEQRAE